MRNISRSYNAGRTYDQVRLGNTYDHCTLVGGYDNFPRPPEDQQPLGGYISEPRGHNPSE